MGTSFLSKLKIFVLNIFFLACVTLSLVAHAEHEASAEYDSQEGYSQAELDQMLAPVALYPDALLMQVLMAATYPLEVVEAARWSRAHGRLEGQRAVRAVEDKDWDPSVKSLVAVPNVLETMDKKLDWTERLGEAFLAQKEDVMDTIQDLRDRALEEDHLASNDNVRVIERRGSVVIETVNPEVVYVPYYDPLVVYGDWWWPQYRPIYWEPWPNYYHHHDVGDAILWGATIAVGAGYLFGTPDWHHHDVYVRYVNNYYQPRSSISVNRTVTTHYVPGERQVWTHEVVHRGSAPYHNDVLKQRYSGMGRPAPQSTISSPNRSYLHDRAPAREGAVQENSGHFSPNKYKSIDKGERALPQEQQRNIERSYPHQKSFEKNRLQQEQGPATQKIQQERRNPWVTEPNISKPAFEKRQHLQRDEGQIRQTPFYNHRDEQRQPQPRHIERTPPTKEERRFNQAPVERKQDFSRMQERTLPSQFRVQETPHQQSVPTERTMHWGGEAKPEKSKRRFGNE